MRSCLTVGVQDTLRLMLDISESAPVHEVLNALQCHFGESLNLATRRLYFYQCRQHQGERFSEYLVRLRLLADNANLDRIPYEELLALHIVANVYNKDLQVELQCKNTSTDFSAIKVECLAWEESERNQASMVSPAKVNVHAISTYERGRNFTNQPSKQTPSSKPNKHKAKKPCNRCGHQVYNDKVCPALD
ncbi:hypothetical protein TCAL_13073 [Tigriopus californicus]|uniref:Paraneoplastic antigen Ma-like C-terminal domain-containing protein n=1 Tax=Tigriopus californicus TaxID=6832 RepID=A0A553PPR2_TIGCA|nr:hypothetical protein TCAL_13073 [Tigriopus californicus]|eukprot:TCALIF_13073-PA protein Name:"Protein of unknown function" AED:0.37 eAED:0.37 QI:0/-1/0/1/-1/1/1/0/190